MYSRYIHLDIFLWSSLVFTTHSFHNNTCSWIIPYRSNKYRAVRCSSQRSLILQLHKKALHCLEVTISKAISKSNLAWFAKHYSYGEYDQQDCCEKPVHTAFPCSKHLWTWSITWHKPSNTGFSSKLPLQAASAKVTQNMLGSFSATSYNLARLLDQQNNSWRGLVWMKCFGMCLKCEASGTGLDNACRKEGFFHNPKHWPHTIPVETFRWQLVLNTAFPALSTSHFTAAFSTKTTCCVCSGDSLIRLTPNSSSQISKQHLHPPYHMGVLSTYLEKELS